MSWSPISSSSRNGFFFGFVFLLASRVNCIVVDNGNVLAVENMCLGERNSLRRFNNVSWHSMFLKGFFLCRVIWKWTLKRVYIVYFTPTSLLILTLDSLQAHLIGYRIPCRSTVQIYTFKKLITFLFLSLSLSGAQYVYETSLRFFIATFRLISCREVFCKDFSA